MLQVFFQQHSIMVGHLNLQHVQQIHQSYIVNINFVKRFTYEEVELMDNTILNISKPYRKLVRQELLRRWAK